MVTSGGQPTGMPSKGWSRVRSAVTGRYTTSTDPDTTIAETMHRRCDTIITIDAGENRGFLHCCLDPRHTGSCVASNGTRGST